MSSGQKTQYLAGSARGTAQDTDDLPTQVLFPKNPNDFVAQLKILKGPGAGQRLKIYAGTNGLGRDGKENTIAVDFGDNAIARVQHFLIHFDKSARVFVIQPNGHPNPVTLNGQTLDARRTLKAGDQIHVGQTTFELEA